MQMIGFKTRLRTNNKQSGRLQHWANVRRYAHNYALGLSYIEQSTLDEGVKWKLSRVNDYDKFFNQGKYDLNETKKTRSAPIIGSGQHVWCKGVPASVSQQAIVMDLKKAWQRCFKKLGKRPRFKSKYSEQGFKLSNVDFKKERCISESRTHIKHAKLGSMRLESNIPPKLYAGKLMNTTFSLKAGHWYVAFIFQIEDSDYYKISKQQDMCVGVDLGVTQHATCYDNVSDSSWHSPYPKAKLKSVEGRIHKLQRKQAKKVKGSCQYNTLKKQIAKLKFKQANIRSNAAHVLSKDLATKAHTVVLEDLKISNMTKSAKGTKEQPGKNVAAKSGLNREILNMGLYDFRMKLMYKSEIYGGKVILVNPRYTSQMCNSCGHTSSDNRKTQSKFECVECGHTDNADINAAKNILKKGLAEENKSV